MAGITIGATRLGKCAIDGCESKADNMYTMWLRFCDSHNPQITVDSNKTWHIKAPKLPTDLGANLTESLPE